MAQRSRASLRHVVSASVVAAGLLVPTLANAQAAQPTNAPANSACPPGSWFCADTQTAPAAPANQPVPQAPASAGAAPLEPLPAPAPATQPPAAQRSLPPPPPVVVYQPPPPVMIVRPEAPPPYYYPPPQPRRKREWGLRVQVEGLSIGRGNGNTGMGGWGLGLRYKPVPAFGVEADVDFVGGTDYNGLHRDEGALTFNGLIFLNPKSQAQVYLLGGFGWSHASVDVNRMSGSSTLDYSYFGAQTGVGLEVRLGRHFAINGDIRGFIRGRIDDHTQVAEFSNGQGQTTNTSGGGLLTLGATLYF